MGKNIQIESWKLLILAAKHFEAHTSVTLDPLTMDVLVKDSKLMFHILHILQPQFCFFSLCPATQFSRNFSAEK